MTSIIAASTQETLSCSPSTGRCPGELQGYMWNVSALMKWPHSLVKKAMGIMATYSCYSHKETLVLSRHPALPPQCPKLVLYPTQVPGIFLLEHQPQLLPVNGSDVHLSALVDALGAYVKNALAGEYNLTPPLREENSRKKLEKPSLSPSQSKRQRTASLPFQRNTYPWGS